MLSMPKIFTTSLVTGAILYAVILGLAPDVIANAFRAVLDMPQGSIADAVISPQNQVLKYLMAPEAVGGKNMDEGVAKALYYGAPFAAIFIFEFIILSIFLRKK